MNRSLVLIIFLNLIQLILIKTESFTSTTHLTQLLNTEKALANILETHLKQDNKQSDQVEKFLTIIKDEIIQAQGNEEFYFGNPVNAYLFIKHLTVDWYAVEELLPKDFSKSFADKLLFPSFEDYTGSAIGLMRLQDTYKLNTSLVANGEISSKYKSKKLSALECYDLGRVAYTNGDFYHTLMWMQEALDHLDNEKTKTTINKIDILDHLAYATSQQGNVEHALAITEEMLSIAPDHIRANNNKIYYERVIQNQTLAEKQRKDDMETNDESDNDSLNLKFLSRNIKNKKFQIKNQRPDDVLDERDAYEELCRKNVSHLSSERQSKLFCRYHHNNHPWLIIGPVKQEQVHDNPAIYLFHDIISNSDMNEIKSLAAPKVCTIDRHFLFVCFASMRVFQLQRAVVRDFVTDTFKPADYRISKSAWLRNDDSPVVTRLSQLIEAVTNLNMMTAEDLQIANYGVGGHYEPHFDFARKSEKDAFAGLGAGNRIATWLTYMSDVEQGGATVFPVTGGYLKPKKGSAAFWYNLYASGEGDYNTRHAACPVLIGNKWVANKWIHERGQEFRRPCSLDPMA